VPGHDYQGQAKGEVREAVTEHRVQQEADDEGDGDGGDGRSVADEP
jgi:hypothetical protein